MAIKKENYGIDFNKVDAAFQATADTTEGQALLKGLSKVIDAFGAGPGKGLNSHELKWLVAGLVDQHDFGTNRTEAVNSRKIGSFTILTAVDQPTT